MWNQPFQTNHIYGHNDDINTNTIELVFLQLHKIKRKCTHTHTYRKGLPVKPRTPCHPLGGAVSLGRFHCWQEDTGSPGQPHRAEIYLLSCQLRWRIVQLPLLKYYKFKSNKTLRYLHYICWTNRYQRNCCLSIKCVKSNTSSLHVSQKRGMISNVYKMLIDRLIIIGDKTII